jgi:hypothetical protein
MDSGLTRYLIIVEAWGDKELIAGTGNCPEVFSTPIC